MEVQILPKLLDSPRELIVECSLIREISGDIWAFDMPRYASICHDAFLTGAETPS